MPEVQPFDWHRLFLGEQTGPLFLLEIVFRTGVMYLYALVFARFVGKRGVGQISPFEFIVIIIISSAAGDAMFYPGVPLLHGIVVLTVVILLHRLLATLTGRYQRIEDTIEGEPLLVVQDGTINEQALGAGTLSRQELMTELRLRGVRDIADIELAFFEPSGRMSVLFGRREQQPAKMSTLPSQFQERM